jgi:YidC/Oxa1 family membrane protein insertase
LAWCSLAIVTPLENHMQLFDTIFVYPIINILLGIYQVLISFGIPNALGFSIIILTVIIRIILYPLTASQLRAAKKMQELTPHLNKLKDKHKNDAKRLQEESMKLYKDHGVNPIAGCIPLLIQIPVIFGLYSVLNLIVHLKPSETIAKINGIAYFDFLRLQNVWDTHFFGVSLGQTPAQLLQSVGPLILLVPILTGVFQFIQSKMMVTPTPKDNKKKKNEPDFQSAMQTQTVYVFPLMIGFFSFNFPLGLSLYWNTFTIFGIIQQYQIQGWGGLEQLMHKLSIAKSQKKK